MNYKRSSVTQVINYLEVVDVSVHWICKLWEQPKSFALIWTTVYCSIKPHVNSIRTDLVKKALWNNPAEPCVLSPSLNQNFQVQSQLEGRCPELPSSPGVPPKTWYIKITQSWELWVLHKSAKEVYNCIDRRRLPHINIESIGLFNIRWRFFWNGPKMLPWLARY